MKAALALLLLATAASAQTGTIVFHFDRGHGLQNYTLTIPADGKQAEYRAATASTPTSPEEPAASFDLAPGDAAKLFEQVSSLGAMPPGGCESRLKNVAQTGIKQITYTRPDTRPGLKCSWNYSDNKTVTTVGEELAGLALTLESGKKLKSDQRFDRLGLDKDMALLLDQAKAGQAWGLEAIAPILRELIADQSLLERVRMRAQRVLEQSELVR